MKKSRVSEPQSRLSESMSSPDPNFWIFSKSATQPPNFLQPLQTDDRVHLDSVANSIDLSSQLKDKALSIFSDIEAAEMKTFQLCSQLMLYRAVKYLSYLLIGSLLCLSFGYSSLYFQDFAIYLRSLTFPYISLLFFGITTVSRMSGPLSAPLFLGCAILDYLFGVLSIFSLSLSYQELVFFVFFMIPLFSGCCSAWLFSLLVIYKKTVVGSFKKIWAFIGTLFSQLIIMIVLWTMNSSHWSTFMVSASLAGFLSEIFLIYHDSVTYYSLLSVVECDEVMRQLTLMEFIAMGLRQNSPS